MSNPSHIPESGQIQVTSHVTSVSDAASRRRLGHGASRCLPRLMPASVPASTEPDACVAWLRHACVRHRRGLVATDAARPTRRVALTDATRRVAASSRR